MKRKLHMYEDKRITLWQPFLKIYHDQQVYVSETSENDPPPHKRSPKIFDSQKCDPKLFDPYSIINELPLRAAKHISTLFMCNMAGSCQINFNKKAVKSFFRHNGVLFFILFGILFGIMLGCILRGIGPFKNPDENPKAMMLLNFPGEILIRIVQLATMPLLVSSLISTIGSLDIKSSGKIGIRTFCFYISTTVFAAMEGLMWFYIIKPGSNMKLDDQHVDAQDQTYAILDMVR